MKVSVDLRDIYEASLEVLDELGWVKGDLQSQDGKVCVVGAVFVACHGAGHQNHLGGPCRIALAKLLDALGCDVTEFNDAPTTTEEDVRRLLKFAAADELGTWEP